MQSDFICTHNFFPVLLIFIFNSSCRVGSVHTSSGNSSLLNQKLTAGSRHIRITAIFNPKGIQNTTHLYEQAATESIRQFYMKRQRQQQSICWIFDNQLLSLYMIVSTVQDRLKSIFTNISAMRSFKITPPLFFSKWSYVPLCSVISFLLHFSE